MGQALREGRAVVALESTVIAHGLPQPLNLQVAMRMEGIIRETGAVPATIAILDGKIIIGLSTEQIERVGASAGISKASLRDLPLLLARGESGATTVSATAHLAAQVGIKVFATGGIGGVHRGWEETLDISADLPALASTSIVVVCAGAKSILDLPATREWLETQGVPVLGFGTNHFPAFYARMSHPPLPVDARVESAKEVASVFKLRRRLGFAGGVLVCVPIPEEGALTTTEVDRDVRHALDAAEEAGVRGRELTPFLLNSIASSTGGRSLEANRLLLENNASIGAQISRAITPPQFV